MRRTLIATTLGLALVGALPQAAVAGNFGSTECGGSPTNCVSLANNTGHTYGEDGLLGNQITDMELHVQSAAEGEYDPIAGFSFHFDPNDSMPDVWVGDYNYPTWDAHAATWCPVDAYAVEGNHAAGTGVCFGQDVRFNALHTYAYNTWAERQHVACHELGHTLGLRHPTHPTYTTTCLHQSLDASSFINSHDVVHVENAH